MNTFLCFVVFLTKRFPQSLKILEFQDFYECRIIFPFLKTHRQTQRHTDRPDRADSVKAHKYWMVLLWQLFRVEADISSVRRQGPGCPVVQDTNKGQDNFQYRPGVYWCGGNSSRWMVVLNCQTGSTDKGKHQSPPPAVNHIASLPLLSSCLQPLPADPDPELSLPLSQLYSQIYCQGMEHKPFTALTLPHRDQHVPPLIISPGLASIYQPADEGCLQSAPRMEGNANVASLPISNNTALPTHSS